MYKRILVPTDGSAVAEAAAEPSVAEAAADTAIDLARACGSEIVALCVALPEPVLQALEGSMTYDPGARADVLLEHATHYVDAIAARAQAAGVPCTKVTTNALDVAEAIADAARQHGCDLIAMGSHGRRGISRLLAGSVTQAVLAYAPVPVMVLRPVAGDVRAPAYAQALARAWPARDPD